ncbi:MAG: DUF3052 domain-containing protein [Bauldia sp.]|uniref:DUF3052 domain-containing protein n=1 Tax=Bauldia sp. TaxID=2575872 RepID=UPI001DF19DBC|nr:DUF3052 domain-containing protein [Bauldia sp.]MCB1495592.1 DUF3052 domain-containing protein [Bauldia sp.]
MATATPAGYSGKPLPVKLGFKPGMAAAFVALPPECEALADWADFASVERIDDWRAGLGRRRYDLIHAFTTRRADILGGLPRLQAAIRPNGMIWVSWPKKASKVPSDVTEDVVRAEALKGDLVDVKVAAVDAVWSALKLVIRKDRR